MGDRREIECWLTDMDGVLVHEGQPIPGAPEFVARLRAKLNRGNSWLTAGA